MLDFLSLLLNSILSGIFIGGFYAAATSGLAISFGILGIVNIAHPAFILIGSYFVLELNLLTGADPIFLGLALMPVFYMLGVGVYSFYEFSFERRGSEAIRGMAFFFGILFVTEVTLTLVFGVDYQLIETAYSGSSLNIGPIGIPFRIFVPFLVSLAMIGCLILFLARSFVGRAIMAVSEDPTALQLMAVSPVKIKRIAFGLSIATAALAGAMLIVIQSVEPSIGRDYIGRLFAITVLGGVGSLGGMVLGAMILGVAESLTSTFYGPSWGPAVSFGLLLLTLVFRPSGLRGRAR